MIPPLQLAALAGIILCAMLLVRVPRALFTEAAGQKPTLRVEAMLILVLGCVGLIAYFSGLGRSVEGRFALALILMTLAAVVYSDFSFLVIPDLYTVVILALSLFAPWKFALQEAALGLLVCGGLLAVVSFLWHRFTEVEGLGFGDVKLAGVIGALLSAQPGLFAIATSAFGAVILTLIARKLRPPKDGQPPLVPYGAALALAAAAFLARSMA